jgi:hypothetical protein
LAHFVSVPANGLAPENYHATTIFPEYYQLQNGHWDLLKNSRMDCVVVRCAGRSLLVKEFRHLKVEQVALGRGENWRRWHLCPHRGFYSTCASGKNLPFTHVSWRPRFHRL